MPRVQAAWFCLPSNFEKNYFTTTTIDDIDTNFTSSTALKSFHGTSLSVFQHTSPENPFETNQIKVNLSEPVKTFFCLPDSYVEIQPTAQCKVEPKCHGNFDYSVQFSNKTITE